MDSASWARRHAPRLAWILASAVLLQGCFVYKWESKGPFETSGAIRHVLVDPVDDHRLYAAAENGGLWVLDDVRHRENGWRPLSDDLENLQMRGIAKSSVDPQYLVTANALGFVYHSKDHGRTWTRITQQNFQYIRRILIAEGMTTVPAGNYTRLAKETRLWIACRIGLFRIRLVNDVFDHVDQIYPRTEDQKPDVLDALRNPLNEEIFIGVRGQGVWKHSDVGDVWTLSASAAVFGDPLSPMIKLAMTSTGSRIVAKLGRNVIVNDAAGDPAGWRATNPVPFMFGGDPTQPDRGGSDIGYRGNYSGQIGEWDHAVAVHPTDPNTIVAGQVALFLSRDGGATWAPLPTGHEDIQSLAFSHDGSSLFIADDGGVFQLPLDSGRLTDLNTNLATAQFFRVGLNGRVAVGDADHQGIRGTRDIEAATVRWERATESASGFGNDGLENDFVSADPKTAGRFFVQFAAQHLLRLNFPQVSAADLLPLNPPGTPLQPFTTFTNDNPVFNQLNYPVGTVAVDPRAKSSTMLVSVHVQPNLTFAIDMTRSANASPSGGPRIPCPAAPPAPPPGGCFQNPVVGTATWTRTFGPVDTPIVSISFSPSEPGKVYALDQAGSVFVRQNIDDPAGVWQPGGSFAVAPGDFARQIVVDDRAPGRLFALSHHRILSSTDGGTSWTPMGQGTLPPAQLNSLCIHPANSKILYVGTASDVLSSPDRGATWASIGAQLPNVPVMQVFTNATHLYAVTFGRGLWRAKLP